MYNGGKILLGIVVFAGLVTGPVWYGVARGKGTAPPDLEKPATAKQCVESKEFMRAKHMELLDTWRDSVVRRAQTVYVASDQKHYEIKLTGTCLGCHTDPNKFCNKCHEYAGVEIYCWDCHQQKRRG